MDTTLIQEEFIRRQYVCDAIKIFIQSNFEFDLKNKLRRGIIQQEIANMMGITLNRTFCQLVNQCMEEQGFKRSIIRGNYYYTKIRRK